MFAINFSKFLAVSALIVTSSVTLLAQIPTPTDGDEPIKIFTEEVHLNVTVLSSYGRAVPTIKADDLLVVESGDPQTITSIQRVSANVLILLDTGGNLNFVKNINRTRLTAKILVENLADENALAVLQSYDRVETVSDWTSNRASVQQDLDRKLFGGNRSQFARSIEAAVAMFKGRPLENRHLIYVGDALDTLATAQERQDAFENLLAANITVHVIAYNKMESRLAENASRRFLIGEAVEPPRVPDHILEGIIQSLPKDMGDGFRQMMKSDRILILRLDNKNLKRAKERSEAWIKSEEELRTLAEDTGGMFQAPEQIETMWTFAIEVARAIDSQYVITYTPTRPIAGSIGPETRKVRVGTHLDGVQVRSRHKIVVRPDRTQ